jgi:hypothetical protein
LRHSREHLSSANGVLCSWRCAKKDERSVSSYALLAQEIDSKYQTQTAGYLFECGIHLPD